MKRLSYALVLLATVSACAGQMANIKTPEGRNAFYQNEAITRIERLQTAAIDADAAGTLPNAQSIAIVRFTVAAAKTIHATPQGWLPTVETGWAELKKTLAADTLKRFESIILTIDAILATVGGGDDPMVEICDGCALSFGGAR